MKKYLITTTLVFTGLFGLVYFSANYLQVVVQSPIKEWQSPIKVAFVIEKNIQPRVNSMAELENGAPIQDETKVSEIKAIPMGNAEMNKLFANLEGEKQ